MFAIPPPQKKKKRYEARRSTDARGAEADAKLRASQKDCAAREALVQRLMGEVERAQDLAKSVEQTAADMKTKFEQGEDELASLREKLNLSENRISHLEGEAAKQSDVVVKQEAKLNVAKGASVRRASLSEGLMGVLMKVQTSVEHSQKFTKDCAARENAHQSTHLNAIEATDNVVLRCCLSASLRRGILLNGFVSYSLTCAQFDVYVYNRLSIRNRQKGILPRALKSCCWKLQTPLKPSWMWPVSWIKGKAGLPLWKSWRKQEVVAKSVSGKPASLTTLSHPSENLLEDTDELLRPLFSYRDEATHQ